MTAFFPSTIFSKSVSPSRPANFTPTPSTSVSNRRRSSSAMSCSPMGLLRGARRCFLQEERPGEYQPCRPLSAQIRQDFRVDASSNLRPGGTFVIVDQGVPGGYDERTEV